MEKGVGWSDTKDQGLPDSLDASEKTGHQNFGNNAGSFDFGEKPDSQGSSDSKSSESSQIEFMSGGFLHSTSKGYVETSTKNLPEEEGGEGSSPFVFANKQGEKTTGLDFGVGTGENDNATPFPFEKEGSNLFDFQSIGGSSNDDKEEEEVMPGIPGAFNRNMSINPQENPGEDINQYAVDITSKIANFSKIDVSGPSFGENEVTKKNWGEVEDTRGTSSAVIPLKPRARFGREHIPPGGTKVPGAEESLRNRRKIVRRKNGVSKPMKERYKEMSRESEKRKRAAVRKGKKKIIDDDTDIDYVKGPPATYDDDSDLDSSDDDDGGEGESLEELTAAQSKTFLNFGDGIVSEKSEDFISEDMPIMQYPEVFHMGDEPMNTPTTPFRKQAAMHFEKVVPQKTPEELEAEELFRAVRRKDLAKVKDLLGVVDEKDKKKAAKEKAKRKRKEEKTVDTERELEIVEKKGVKVTSLAVNTSLFGPYRDMHIFEVLLEKSEKELFVEHQHLIDKVKANKTATELFKNKYPKMQLYHPLYKRSLFI